ncbi:MAG: hypothetical protein JXB07_08275 [Anaerolineae bacterium]|nr:hypothetical protein [Anaerolineae bacterium]
MQLTVIIRVGKLTASVCCCLCFTFHEMGEDIDYGSQWDTGETTRFLEEAIVSLGDAPALGKLFYKSIASHVSRIMYHA